jgi:hypothetical protein
MLTGSLVLDGKNLTEGFDMEFGRMNAVLGTTPNPLTPTVGAGPVLGAAFYIDPPTENLTSGKTVLWRFMHLGVDSHAIHFHLFNVQLVNRVDWTNTIKPPEPEEMGWKETIRTNPFEDIIVAIKPQVMSLPFKIPNSVRLLDVTQPAGTAGNFLPVPPPIGLPAVAQTTNVVTNFGWEYVWHCHLLGHEENDMMRPLVLVVPPAPVPVWGAFTVNPAGTSVTLNWTTTDSANTTGYTIQRATNTAFTANLQTINVTGGTTLTVANATAANTRYFYRIRGLGQGGDSAFSTTLTVVTAFPPTNLTAAATRTGTRERVLLNWTPPANVTGITNFQIQRANNAAFTAGVVNTTRANTITTLTQTNLVRRAYYYRIRSTIAAGVTSAWTNATPLPVPRP